MKQNPSRMLFIAKNNVNQNSMKKASIFDSRNSCSHLCVIQLLKQLTFLPRLTGGIPWV